MNKVDYKNAVEQLFGKYLLGVQEGKSRASGMTMNTTMVDVELQPWNEVPEVEEEEISLEVQN